MADYRSWVEQQSKQYGVNPEESDWMRLNQTNPDDVGRLQSALTAQYQRRGASGQTGSGTDSGVLSAQGIGSARSESASGMGGGAGAPMPPVLQPRPGTAQPYGAGPDFGALYKQQQDYLGQMQQQQSAAQAQLQQMLQAQQARMGEDTQRRQQYENAVRGNIMGILGQGPVDADKIANNAEARGYSRLAERSQQQLRAQQAERGAAMGTGATTQGEQSGALASGIEGGQRDLAERTFAMQGQLMGRELTERRQQLMQAMQMGAGLMTAEQQNQLRTELAQIDTAMQQSQMGQQGSMGLMGLMQQGNLGQGQLGLGFLNSFRQNDQFYSGLGADMGYKQAQLNANPFQYLFA